jgi:1-acyl-sn-glycerol-3-phosphate acyltransferase
MRSGIGTLAARSKVPVVPAGLAGTFEAWPKSRRFPRRHPIRVHYGRTIQPEELLGLDPDAASELIGHRIAEAVAVARAALPGAAKDLPPR